MIVCNIDSLLEKKDKTRYWLSKQTGIAYDAIARLANNETTKITFHVAEKVCNSLNCTLEDLLTIKEE